jgi:hypothetical protein
MIIYYQTYSKLIKFISPLIVLSINHQNHLGDRCTFTMEGSAYLNHITSSRQIVVRQQANQMVMVHNTT